MSDELVSRLRTLAGQIDPCLVGGRDAVLLRDSASLIERQQALIAELRGHISEQITHAEQRIADGKAMGASIWRIALEDIARENRALLERNTP